MTSRAGPRRTATAARRRERDRTGHAPVGLPPDCERRSARRRHRNNCPAGQLRPAVQKERLRLVVQKEQRANSRTGRKDSLVLRAPSLPPARWRARAAPAMRVLTRCFMERRLGDKKTAPIDARLSEGVNKLGKANAVTQGTSRRDRTLLRLPVDGELPGLGTLCWHNCSPSRTNEPRLPTRGIVLWARFGCARGRSSAYSILNWGAPHMIDLYYWPMPNGKKVTILLEELGTPYRHRALQHR